MTDEYGNFNRDYLFSLLFIPKNCLSYTLQTLPDAKLEAACISPNHLNGFLKLLDKPTQNKIGASV